MFILCVTIICVERERDKERGGERERKMSLFLSLSLSPLSLSRKNFPFIKNCETCLIRGRKLIKVTQTFIMNNENTSLSKSVDHHVWSHELFKISLNIQNNNIQILSSYNLLFEMFVTLYLQ